MMSSPYLTTRRLQLPALLLAILLPAASPALAAVDFLGTGSLPGTDTDLSGLSGTMTNGATTLPENLLGAFGSGIAYTGSGNRFIVTPDRGPFDGVITSPTVGWQDRFHEIDLAITANGSGGWNITPSLVSTTLMRETTGAVLSGQLSTSRAASAATRALAFDPEGVRVSAGGNSIFVSDEYGPTVREIDRSTGTTLRTFGTPTKYTLTDPTQATGNNGNAANTRGRVDNRGMEGLAISPDGTAVYGIMQNPLIQDGGRSGLKTRILKYDTATGQATGEYVYQLDSSSLGVNELLAINDHEFLAIERDGNGGTSAAVKKIYKIDIAGATNVIGAATDALPAGATAVSKTAFIDLLNPAYGLAGTAFPEKIEGLAFGADLADGRHTLIVTNDNDLITTNPNNFYVFAFGNGDLNLVPQAIAAVPEPSEWAMLAAGLGLMGFTARRRARRA